MPSIGRDVVVEPNRATRIVTATLGCLRAVWPWTLALTGAAWLFAIEIAIWGWVPGATDLDTRLAICWSSLGLSYLLIHVSYIAGFADDLGRGSA